MRRYVARLGKNAISVYEAPEMGLLDKKSIKLDGVQVPFRCPMLRLPGLLVTIMQRKCTGCSCVDATNTGHNRTSHPRPNHRRVCLSAGPTT